MITIHVLFLGPSRDLAGTESASLELADGATIAELRRFLSDRYGQLGGAMPSIRFAINEDFAVEAAVLNDGDEVALIPPVSGGSSHGVLVDLVREPIAMGRVRAFVEGEPCCGAVVTFEGITRSEPDEQHGSIARLDYEAYEQMARRNLERMAGDASEKWHLRRVAMIHRLGPVPVGEASVVISVASGHREASFEACRWLIDTLKQDVPIWKKDVFEDGHTSWVEGKRCQDDFSKGRLEAFRCAGSRLSQRVGKSEEKSS